MFFFSFSMVFIESFSSRKVLFFSLFQKRFLLQKQRWLCFCQKFFCSFFSTFSLLSQDQCFFLISFFSLVLLSTKTFSLKKESFSSESGFSENVWFSFKRVSVFFF